MGALEQGSGRDGKIEVPTKVGLCPPPPITTEGSGTRSTSIGNSPFCDYTALPSLVGYYAEGAPGWHVGDHKEGGQQRPQGEESAEEGEAPTWGPHSSNKVGVAMKQEGVAMHTEPVKCRPEHGHLQVMVDGNGNGNGNGNVGAPHDQDSLKVFHIESGHLPRTSTFFQATLNCVSMLFGLGILSSPYAVAQAGWMGAIISLIVATTYGYAAHLMAKCVQYHPDCGTYQDMAKFALGKRTRKLITALFYIEITGTLVGYCISVGDNMDYIFPSTGFSLPGLSNRNFMIFVASLIILPSVWLRDLSALSFTSMWCIASTILLLISVMLAATINHVGFTHSIPFLRIQGVPVAAGLYAFSYGGTSVFPSIYKSMKDPSKFPQVLVISFSIATASMVGLGIAGAYMFGELTKSQVTLSMPIHFISTKIVLWMTVLTPICKFALQLSPITTAVEAQLYRRCKASRTVLFGVGTLMRSCVLAFIAILAMVFPYFEYIVALVGSSMTISICMIFPCLFYLKLYWNELKPLAKIMIITLVIMGSIVGAYGTVVAIQGLINKTKSHST